MARGLNFVNVYLRIEPKDGGGFETKLQRVEAVVQNPTATDAVDREPLVVPNATENTTIRDAALTAIQADVLTGVRAAVSGLP